MSVPALSRAAHRKPYVRAGVVWDSVRERERTQKKGRKEGGVSIAGERETLVFVSFRFDLRGGEREGETEGGTTARGHV